MSPPTKIPFRKPASHCFGTGWRRMAHLNIVMLSVSFLMLLAVFTSAMSQTGDLRQPWQLYTADCKSTSNVNTILHLLVNIISTGVLASSNFFMQILNAPTRKEVDHAHKQGTWLDIGVSSLRNAFRLSLFKLTAWLILLLSSTPLHLLFNSSIFQIDSRFGDFHVTIATESFIQGDDYFLPGASLVTRDMFSDQDVWEKNEAYRQRVNARDLGNRSLIPTLHDLRVHSYAAQEKNVSEIATQASGWQRLDVKTCRSTYSNNLCSGLKKYRNVVVVAEGSGWKRSDLWNFSTTTNDLWEPVIPGATLNSLWFNTQCNMQGSIKGSEYAPLCLTDCIKVLQNATVDADRWYLDIGAWFDKDGPVTPNLKVSHCMAEQRATYCTIAVSKLLLLAVILSIFLKIITCVIVIWKFGSEEPLVTPGDAIASFISTPRKRAPVIGFLTQTTTRQRVRDADLEYKTPIAQPLYPSQWAKKEHRRTSAIHWEVWLTTYGMLLPGYLGVVTCFALQIVGQVSLQWLKLDTFEATSILRALNIRSAFIASVLAVNAPQLYISFWYIVYNSLLTRLEMGWEWDQFSVQYRPLRVTRPVKQQVSTHRLQLPYRVSIPLAISSTLAHWLLSNALFIIVSRGSYYQTGDNYYRIDKELWDYSNDPYDVDRTNLPWDATVVIGTASLPVLILIVNLSIMLVIPLILSRKRLPGYMPVVGANSLAMQAACQVSPLSRVKATLESDESDSDFDKPVSSKDGSPETGKRLKGTKEMVFYRLKWGEVKMPDGWLRQEGTWTDCPDDEVGHLSFGTVFDDPRPPVEGRWYK